MLADIFQTALIILFLIVVYTATGAYMRCYKKKFPFAEWGIGILIAISIYAIATDDGYIHPPQQIVRATR